MAGIEPLPDKEQTTDTLTIQVGQAQVELRATIPAETTLRVTVETVNARERFQKTVNLGSLPPFPGSSPRFLSGFRIKKWAEDVRSVGLERLLPGLALLVYMFSRLFQIGAYPIYFFSDEAVQTVLAADLVRDAFHSYDGEFLPTFFYNGYQYNLSTSVYLQVLPYMLFGKSAALTRSLAGGATLLAAAVLWLMLSKVFNQRHAWTAILLLAITPAWFLHSRTAFETGLGVTFFAVFLFCYLMYRTQSPRYLYAAVLAGALAFYSYSPMRVVIGLAALLLFFSDIRYHFEQRKTVLVGAGLLLLTAVPLLRFNLLHPSSSLAHLRVLNSYWIQPIPVLEKIKIYLLEYLNGLNPLYWYLPNDIDMERHVMNGYGHVFWFTFPLMLIGLVIAVRRIREPAYRALLISLFAAPAGAALVALGITRALVMVVPLALLSALGLVWLLEKAGMWLRGNKQALSMVVFLALVGIQIFMTRDALVNGPFWHQDYGLGGMQWGAKQLFEEVRSMLAETPQTRLIVSPSWANGTDTIARFYFSDPLPFQMASIEGYFDEIKQLDANTLFVMIPEEFDRMQDSGKFADIQIEKTISYPNGDPGFYFVRLDYVENIEQILSTEREERKVLQEEKITVAGEEWQVDYSYLDMGTIDQLFDGNIETLVRTMEANPMVVEMAFPSPRPIQALDIRVGGTPTAVKLTLTDSEGSVHEYEQLAEESPVPRFVHFSMESPVNSSGVRVEVLSTRDQEPAHVHLWEIVTHTTQAGDRD